MIEIGQMLGTAARQQVAVAATFEDAKRLAHELFPIAFIDDDADYQDCADFITEHGAIYYIQPVGFEL